MTKRIMVLALVALAALPGTAGALPEGAAVKRHKGGLDFAVDMAWVKGTKKIFFTEKNTGRIRVIVGRNLRSRACARLNVNNNGERGLLGIALHPNFKKNKWLYVYYANAQPLENRVTRFKVSANRCRNPRHIVTGISAASSGYHNGGQLEFVGGKLFVSTGEAHNPSAAQNTNNLLGKILRYNPDGTVPQGNPFGAGNPVWAYGLRNPFGLAKRPGRKALYSTENGPHCDDELNRIRKGRNYGWGTGYQCGTAGVGDGPKGPMIRWSNIIVPTDPHWYEGKIKNLSGSLYVGDYGGRLRRVVMNPKGTKVRRQRVIHTAPSGIVDVAKGPGGWLYFVTPQAIYKIVRG